jgi:hypothetical protein
MAILNPDPRLKSTSRIAAQCSTIQLTDNRFAIADPIAHLPEKMGSFLCSQPIRGLNLLLNSVTEDSFPPNPQNQEAVARLGLRHPWLRTFLNTDARPFAIWIYR